jgi:hypothetical protein
MGADLVLSYDIKAGGIFLQFGGYRGNQLAVILMDYSEISFLIQN